LTPGSKVLSSFLNLGVESYIKAKPWIPAFAGMTDRDTSLTPYDLSGLFHLYFQLKEFEHVFEGKDADELVSGGDEEPACPGTVHE